MGKNELVCDCNLIHENFVSIAKEHKTDNDILIKMVDFYKALSDSTRIKIVDLLKTTELCVCDISVLLNMTKSAVSHQLKYLRERNLIKAHKQGKEVWYSLADEHVKEMFDLCNVHVMELNND